MTTKFSISMFSCSVTTFVISGQGVSLWPTAQWSKHLHKCYYWLRVQTPIQNMNELYVSGFRLAYPRW